MRKFVAFSLTALLLATTACGAVPADGKSSNRSEFGYVQSVDGWTVALTDNTGNDWVIESDSQIYEVGKRCFIVFNDMGTFDIEDDSIKSVFVEGDFYV